MDLVVAIAIGVLAVFIGAVIFLVVLFVRFKCKKEDLISQQHKECRPEAQLITESQDGLNLPPGMDVELGDVNLSNPRLEQLLNNEQWVDDASGLVPHCLSILKTCHHLTEQLVGMTMKNAAHIRNQGTLGEIVMAAKRINPRVDEVVQSLCHPLDPRLLEARFTALVLSVSHLVMVTKNACQMPGSLDWIDRSLAEVEDTLKILREVSTNIEANAQAQAQQASQTTSQSITVAIEHPHQLEASGLGFVVPRPDNSLA
ncbi:transmembrane protein 98 [Aplysia californica]|uniref:Transmembrane protein 98 n=1 Tax=Aplysia californica TaxID=6500 RepID=A0ABM0JCR5_APLCA|nr:transmembrane protein 98 [Aplysia californica]